MKDVILNRYWLSLLALVLIAGACAPPVVFDKAYPLGEENLKEIPEAYTGVFICDSDSALVVIGSHDITLRKENYFMLPIKDVEEREDCRIAGEQMYVAGRSECIPLEFINDSIIKGTVVEHDTLFLMGERSVARLYKGHVVLSQEIEIGQWAISLLSMEDNRDVTYKAITERTNIENVRKITLMEDITTIDDKKDRYIIKPTMKQFDELIKDEEVFIECEYLKRIILDKGSSDTLILKL